MVVATIFFTEGRDTIAKAVHKYCFRSEGTITDEERNTFFDKLGVRGDEIPSGCDEVSPTRGCIITRVKFEMLKNFFQEKEKQETSENLALLGMYLTTQDFLSWIKYRSTCVLNKEFPELRVTWAFFQCNMEVRNGEAWLKITLVNYKPESDAWQAKLLLPTDNKRYVKAQFQISLDKGPEIDLGEISIIVGKKHTKYKKHLGKAEKEKLWGIYNSDKRTCIKYRDTMPTW